LWQLRQRMYRWCVYILILLWLSLKHFNCFNHTSFWWAVLSFYASKTLTTYVFRRYDFFFFLCRAGPQNAGIVAPKWICTCVREGNQWGIFPPREIRGFIILLCRSEKNYQNISRSGNKMINVYMPQHIAWRINTNQRIAKTISLAKS